jgi:hypothetical protein
MDSESASRDEISGQSNWTNEDAEEAKTRAAQPGLNRAQRRDAERRKPLTDAENQAKIGEVGKGLKSLFGGGARKTPYVPVLTSLEQIGLNPRLMQIRTGEELKQCFVIECQELIYKEWKHMTDAKFAEVEPQGEEHDED